MASSGNTPIQLFYSNTAGNVPLSANLVIGELAINVPDGKLFYLNSANVVTVLANANTVGEPIAVAGFAQANAAFLQANSVYQYANTLSPQDNVARYTANSAALYANGAFTQANAAFAIANSGSGGSSAGPYANAAFAVANSAAIYANGAFAQANAAYAKANTSSSGVAYLTVNRDTFTASGSPTFILSVTPPSSNNIIVNLDGVPQLNSSYTITGTTLTMSETPVVGAKIDVMIFLNGSNEANVASGGLYANAAFIQANAAFAAANSAGGGSTPAYAFTQANAAYNQANTATTNALAAGSYANSAFTQSNSAAQLIPQNRQATNYTLQLSDAGKHIYYTQSSDATLYIPAGNTVAFSNGTSIMIISQTTSSANVIVSPNTGVSLYLAGNTTSSSRIVTTYGMASLIQVAANTWFINGTGVV